MGLSYGIWLLLLGALAVPNLFLEKKPELKPTLDKLVPFQGWIGVISVLWGLQIVVLGALLNLTLLGAGVRGLLWWVTMLATGVVTLGLGLLLGVGTMKTFVKDPAAQAKLDQTVTRIAPYQGKLGIAAIALAVWSVLAFFLFA